MEFLRQISQKWYFWSLTSFYPDRSDIEPNEPRRAYVPMGLYQTPASNRESIFLTCPVPGRFSQKPCLKDEVHCRIDVGILRKFLHFWIQHQVFPRGSRSYRPPKWLGKIFVFFEALGPPLTFRKFRKFQNGFKGLKFWLPPGLLGC